MNPGEVPLRDIHLPEPAGWWPPAPGWWIVAALLTTLGLIVWRRWRRGRRLRIQIGAARTEFERLRSDWQRHRDAQRLARELSQWLRRVAMTLHSRRDAASLTGAEWWQFLDRAAGTVVFGTDGGRLIGEAPYRAAADVDGERLLQLCERWLAAARRQARSARS